MKKISGGDRVDWKIIVVRVILKVILAILLLGFGSNILIRTISYSFYKGNKNKSEVTISPHKLTYAENLTGYGYNLENESDSVILCFGGSFYVAYNTVGMFAPYYDTPFLSVDYYGTQESKGKMNLKTMKASAEGLYDYVVQKYSGRKIIIIGHSYGCGMAAYLASVRECSHLYLASGYRDLADIYNKIMPIFWGPLKIFISDNMDIKSYAEKTTCPVTVIGSEKDKTLSSKLQGKVAECYKNATLKIFDDIEHEHYLKDERVVSLIKASLTDNN
ncbi:MAG TPA: alpha/beta hydrolase [Clostridia bacterium]|jgi:hypothetical protein|nr:alpha/beta hydrolase [Clostridia bacterium]